MLVSQRSRPQKSPAQCRAFSSERAHGHSEAGHHALKAKQMGERFKFAPLVVTEAHDQREPRGFEAFDIHPAHVDGCRAAVTLRLPRIFHLAQFGLDSEIGRASCRERVLISVLLSYYY